MTTSISTAGLLVAGLLLLLVFFLILFLLVGWIATWASGGQPDEAGDGDGQHGDGRWRWVGGPDGRGTSLSSIPPTNTKSFANWWHEATVAGSSKSRRILPGIAPAPPPPGEERSASSKSGAALFRSMSASAFAATSPPPPAASSVFFTSNPSATTPVLHLFIGIGLNYYQTPNELLTCNNDVRAVRQWWRQRVALSGGDNARRQEFILSDEPNQPSYLAPTVANWRSTIKQVHRLVNEQDQAGGVTDIMYMSSSHGFFQHTWDPAERDGNAETVVLTDGFLWDHEIVASFLQPLPSSVHVLAVFDSCNSGSAMNLPWLYNELSDTCDQDSRNLSLAAGVWCLSGCQDAQTSAAGRTRTDLSVLTAHLTALLAPGGAGGGGGGGGGLSATAVTTPLTATQFYRALRASLRQKKEFQIPMLSVSHPTLTQTPLF